MKHILSFVVSDALIATVAFILRSCALDQQTFIVYEEITALHVAVVEKLAFRKGGPMLLHGSWLKYLCQITHHLKCQYLMMWGNLQKQLWLYYTCYFEEN